MNTFISQQWREQTGGDCVVEFITFTNGTLVTISEECTQLHQLPRYPMSAEDIYVWWWNEGNGHIEGVAYAQEES